MEINIQPDARKQSEESETQKKRKKNEIKNMKKTRPDTDQKKWKKRNGMGDATWSSSVHKYQQRT